MRTPETLKFAVSHEWAAHDDADIQSDIIVCGISQFAVDQLTDIIVIDLPKVGTQVTQGKAAGEIESVKAVSDIYSPVTGEIIEVNDKLVSDVSLLSSDPYGEGWLFRIRPVQANSVESLMSYEEYQAQIAKEKEH
jgi:glycine cleavage system H protein